MKPASQLLLVNQRRKDSNDSKRLSWLEKDARQRRANSRSVKQRPLSSCSMATGPTTSKDLNESTKNLTCAIQSVADGTAPSSSSQRNTLAPQGA